MRIISHRTLLAAFMLAAAVLSSQILVSGGRQDRIPHSSAESSA